MPLAFAQTGAADPKVNAQPNANQSAAAAGTPAPAPSAASVDTNFDGNVSRDEAVTAGMADASFDSADSDANGLLSIAQYESANASK
jgi:hypothetical protein